jgi:hypothetical protein
MPEETSPTQPAVEPRGRRSSRQAPEESGGSKTLVIILLVLIAGLGFALFKRNSSAGTQSEKDAGTISMLTSNVAELRTKLVLEHGNAAVAQTNHQAVLDRRTAELLTASNRLVQTSLLLARAQEEMHAAQAELPAKAVAIAALEAQRDELQRQAATIPALQREVVDSKEKLNQVYLAQATLYDTLGRVRLEVADLERKLHDPLFLRFQERRVLEEAEIRQKAAAKERINTSDPRVRLELQPDGTVRPAIAASAQPRK